MNSMPSKVFNRTSLKFKAGMVLSTLGLLSLTGCSTISDGANSVGAGVVWLAEGATQITTDVDVAKTDDKHYVLKQSFNQPVTSLDSWAMRIEARKVCPDGYVYVNRNAVKSGALGVSGADCAASHSCGYELQWRIKCQDVPQEPFSLFGKT